MPENEPVTGQKPDGTDVARYERKHREIFNQTEQERLCRALRTAVEVLATGSEPRAALDYGCGSGNLTRHLIDLGFHTVSADVSDGFLQLAGEKFSASGMSSTLKLNGKDLSGVASGQFDLVATYSVLHHVPDYLAIVEEMCRVTKPGGVLYIDHEVTETYYQRSPVYLEFLRKARPRVNLKRIISLLLDVKGYIHILRRLRDPRYKREGDIHVWPDDHIEWSEIERILAASGFETVLKQDYLLCKGIYDPYVYDEYKDRCADERVLISRKKRL